MEPELIQVHVEVKLNLKCPLPQEWNMQWKISSLPNLI